MFFGMLPGPQSSRTIQSGLPVIEIALRRLPVLRPDRYGFSETDKHDQCAQNHSHSSHASHVAGFFAGLGVKPGDMVAVFLPNGLWSLFMRRKVT